MKKIIDIKKFDKIVCMYYGRGKSMTYLADKFKVSSSTIWKTLKRNRIKTRPHSICGENNPRRLFLDKEEKEICEQYKNGKTTVELANKLGKNPALISRILMRNNYIIRRDKKTGKVGRFTGRWNGGISYDEKGYKRLYLPDYKFINKSGLVKEHRFIMEQKIGRKLEPNEIVHHINCNKIDNRLENLKVMTSSEHTKLHNNKTLP